MDFFFIRDTLEFNSVLDIQVVSNFMVTTKVNNLVPGLACLHSDFLWIDSNSELQEETH